MNGGEYLVPLSGTLIVSLHDGYSEWSIIVQHPGQGLYIPARLWREVKNSSHDGVALIVRAVSLNDAEFVCDLARFCELVKNNHD